MTLSLKWWIAGVTVIPFFIGACSLTRKGYWSPKYTVVEKSPGKFPMEVREYSDLVLAATPAKPDAEGRDGSFMRLFRFITGKNEQSQKIPMTTPVFFRGIGSEETMSFVMPEKDGIAGGPPKPTDENVRIEKRPGGTYAVSRMKGRRRHDRETSLQHIEAELEKSSWKASGPAEFASYDPPWIPQFLRRDEVFLPVKPRPKPQP
jgi:hypothetical protein